VVVSDVFVGTAVRRERPPSMTMTNILSESAERSAVAKVDPNDRGRMTIAGMDLWIFVGVAAGLLLVIVAAVAAVCLHRRRKTMTEEEIPPEEMNSEVSGMVFDSLHEGTATSFYYENPDDLDIGQDSIDEMA
jgi:hypothetical protein